MEVAIIISIIAVCVLANIIYMRRDMTIKYDPIIWKDLIIIKQWLALCDPREFEIFCTTLFTLLGYKAITTDATNDFGRDCIIYHPDGTETLVECKLYRAETKIDRPIAQKLMGSMAHEQKMIKKEVKGIIMTTGEATEEAKAYCEDMDIEIYYTEKIMEMVKEVGTSKVLLACGITPRVIFEPTIENLRPETE